MNKLVLVNSDNCAAMAKMENDFIDLTVTSPPYDNLRTYNGNAKDWNEAKWKDVIQLLYRVTKPGGVVVWIVADATIDGSESGTSFRQALWAAECGFRLHDTMIYEKPALAFPDSGKRYYSAFEFMFVWSKGEPKTFNAIRDHKNLTPGLMISARERRPDGSMNSGKSRTGERQNFYSIRRNIWRIANNTGPRNEHPAIFPEALARDHILTWSNPGDLVMDPFTGSGTTGAMAVTTGRDFVGIELDPTYFEVAKKRIKKAESQANSGLYSPAAPPTVKSERRGMF